MGGARGRLAGAALRVGAGDIEVAQRHIAQIVRARRVGQHDLGHALGRAVGRHGRQRRILGDRRVAGHAVDGGGRGEDEVAHAALHRHLDQGARLDRVVEVVAERIRNRIGHHDGAGEMDDGIDAAGSRERAGPGLGRRRRLRRGWRPSGTAQARPVDRLSRTTTASPASSSSSAMWLPMYPAPPVTRTLIPLSFFARGCRYVRAVADAQASGISTTADAYARLIACCSLAPRSPDSRDDEHARSKQSAFARPSSP